jgi:hypothetical protein
MLDASTFVGLTRDTPTKILGFFIAGGVIPHGRLDPSTLVASGFRADLRRLECSMPGGNGGTARSVPKKFTTTGLNWLPACPVTAQVEGLSNCAIELMPNTLILHVYPYHLLNCLWDFIFSWGGSKLLAWRGCRKNLKKVSFFSLHLMNVVKPTVGPFDPEGRPTLELLISVQNLTLARPIWQDYVKRVKANCCLTAGSSQRCTISKTQPIV